MMHVLALAVEIRLPQAGSLKDKRRVVRHLLDTARSRYGVSCAEVDAQDKYQRAELGFASVASSQKMAEEVIQSVEDFVWSHPELEVIAMDRSWLEIDR